MFNDDSPAALSGKTSCSVGFVTAKACFCQT